MRILTTRQRKKKQQDVDLILREIERSDNESLRLKKEVMRQFILTRFYDLPEDADIMEAFYSVRERADEG